jgi:predicted RNase H-like HicB family nuclease
MDETKTYKLSSISSIKMAEKFNVIIEEGEDGYLTSFVVELPGCHTQARTYDELMKRTKEAISLYLSVKKTRSKTKFLGLQQLEV